MENGKTIMIVEDDLNFHELYKQMLEDTDHNIVPALDGDQALAKLFGKKPDLIILDILLGMVDGDSFFRYIKQSPEYSDIPVIIVSGVQFPHNELKELDPDLGYINKTLLTREKLVEEIETRIG